MIFRRHPIQEPRLFADTIFENIAIGAVSGELSLVDLKIAVLDAARAAHAHNFIERLPEGYQTKIGDMKLLSGGQRQRIVIARALMRRPKILVLDEATSALDSTSEDAVQGAIDNALAVGNMTCIIVTHRLRTITKAVGVPRPACVAEVEAAGRTPRKKPAGAGLAGEPHSHQSRPTGTERGVQQHAFVQALRALVIRDLARAGAQA